MSLNRRIAKLENQRLPSRRMFVIKVPQGTDEDTAMAAVGVDPSPADTVVFVQHFGSEISPRLINVEGMMA